MIGMLYFLPDFGWFQHPLRLNIKKYIQKNRYRKLIALGIMTKSILDM
jgi:hypothetical protein